MKEFMNLLIIALLCEALWENCKMIWQKGKFSWDKIGALGFGVLVATGTGIDLFGLVDVPFIFPYVGEILTGILIARGANFVHDLLGKINTTRGKG